MRAYNEDVESHKKSRTMIKNINSYHFLSFLLCIMLFSCFQGSSIYIISKEDSIKREKHRNQEGIILMPPKAKYAVYNFIIDSTNNVYFYSFPEEKPGMSVNDGEESESIELMPNHFFSIPQGKEKSFFEKNVLLQRSSRPIKYVMVASFKDTLRGDFLTYLTSISTEKSKKVSLSIRLALTEEHEVIKYKFNGRYYDPKKP